MPTVRKYAGYAFVGSVLVFVWSIAFAVSPKVVMVTCFCFCVCVTAGVHHMLTYLEPGGSDVTPLRGDTE